MKYGINENIDKILQLYKNDNKYYYEKGFIFPSYFSLVFFDAV